MILETLLPERTEGKTTDAIFTLALTGLAESIELCNRKPTYPHTMVLCMSHFEALARFEAMWTDVRETAIEIGSQGEFTSLLKSGIDVLQSIDKDNSFSSTQQEHLSDMIANSKVRLKEANILLGGLPVSEKLAAIASEYKNRRLTHS